MAYSLTLQPVMSLHDAILLSTGRRGTFMILTALAARPDVRVYDQVIAPDFLEGASGHEVVQHVFGRLGEPRVTTVLPVAWCNARNCHPGFWEALRERRVRVIHLRRRNLLRSYVSRQLARTSGEWIASAPQATHPTVTIDPVSCRHFVIDELDSDQRAVDFFSNQESLNLCYEDLLTDYDLHLAQLQSFLGLVPRRLRPTSHKQVRLPLASLVRNYAELREAWKDTPWPHWLSDDIEAAVETAGPEQPEGRLITN